MKVLLLTIIGFSGIFGTSSSLAAQAPLSVTKEEFAALKVMPITAYDYNGKEFSDLRKALNQGGRKVADVGQMSFSENSLSADFKDRFRSEWLKVKNADQLEALLLKSEKEYDTYPSDVKYYLSQIHTMIPLRGIVWRLRPLFEKRSGFLGSNTTHVTAVQFVREMAANMKMFTPTEQWEAGFEFLTTPSTSMTTAMQFKSIREFQTFMSQVMANRIQRNTDQIRTLLNQNPSQVYVWDNLMNFGTGTFRDGVRRYVGHGPAEVMMTLATAYRSLHNIYMFSAYNQDETLNIVQQMGAHLGMDSMPVGFAALGRRTEMGLTDQERAQIVLQAARTKRFLELQDYHGTTLGTDFMRQALNSLRNSVNYTAQAYELLQGKSPAGNMGINPLFAQPEAFDRLGSGIENMKAAVEKRTEILDSISGKSVVIDLPNFYLSPPKSLALLMATGWDSEKPAELTVTNKSGERLKVRNYFRGRATQWNNEAWANYVPSAKGKGSNYMSEARRILQYSPGTSLVFDAPDYFVK